MGSYSGQRMVIYAGINFNVVSMREATHNPSQLQAVSLVLPQIQ